MNQTCRILLEKQGQLISDVLLWTTSHGRAKVGRPAQTYIQQLSKDMGCSPDDLPEAMNEYMHTHTHTGACGVMVIVVGNGHGDMSSNPGQD